MESSNFSDSDGEREDNSLSNHSRQTSSKSSIYETQENAILPTQVSTDGLISNLPLESNGSLKSLLIKTDFLAECFEIKRLPILINQSKQEKADHFINR